MLAPKKTTPSDFGARGRPLTKEEAQRLSRVWADLATVGEEWGERMLRVTWCKLQMDGCASREEAEQVIRSAMVMVERTLRHFASSMKQSS